MPEPRGIPTPYRNTSQDATAGEPPEIPSFAPKTGRPMGTSVERPPAVAHGGNLRHRQLPARCRRRTEGAGDRQQTQRCAVGSLRKHLNDVVSEKHQRCTVGSQLSMWQKVLAQVE